MKKVLILCIMLLSIASCMKTMRYTSGEINEYPPSIQEHIKKGEITTGMTLIQARYAWGPPDVVNVLPPDGRGRERIEWVYKKWGVFRTILRFADKKITEIVTTEPGIIK